MKRQTFLIAVVVMTVLGLAPLSFAWNVTLRNDTGHRCKVRLYTDHLFSCDKTDYQFIETQSTYTWKTGGWCPLALEGEIYANGWKKIKSVNIGLGNEINDACQWSSAACWNSSWLVCRKRGSGAVNDNDYGFCK